MILRDKVREEWSEEVKARERVREEQVKKKRKTEDRGTEEKRKRIREETIILKISYLKLTTPTGFKNNP